MTTDSYTFDPGVFDDAATRDKINAAAEGTVTPGFPWNHPAVKFARWYIKTFKHKPRSSEEWQLHGDAYTAAKDYDPSGTDDSAGTDSDESVLDSYVNSNSTTTTGTTDTTGTTGTTGTTTTTGTTGTTGTTDTTGTTGTTYSDADYFPEGWRADLDGEFWTDPLTREIWKYLGDDTWEYAGGGDGPEVDGPEVDGPEVDNTVIDDIKVVAKPPSGRGQIGELVRWAGVVYIYDALGGWIPSPDPLHNPPMEETTVTGKIPEKADILGGLESLLGMGIGLDALKEMVANMPNSGSGNEELSFLEKLLRIFASKKGIDQFNEQKVPTSQMDAQSAVGKEWGLPSREGMVMQGMGPNYLQGQQYAMPKGTTMPAATHISGNPLLKQIEGGEQGGIMGLKSHGDITPAFLEPGEFVFTKKATDNMGAKRLYKLMQQAEQMGMR